MHTSTLCLGYRIHNGTIAKLFNANSDSNHNDNLTNPIRPTKYRCEHKRI